MKKRILLGALLCSLFSIYKSAAQCSSYSSANVCNTAQTYTNHNLGASLIWKSITITSGGFHQFTFGDSLSSAPNLEYAYYEFYTCNDGSENLEMHIMRGSTVTAKRNANDYSCGGGSTNEFGRVHANRNSVQAVKVQILRDSCRAPSDTFTLYYRVACRSGQLGLPEYPDSVWVGSVFNSYNGNRYFESLGQYGTETPNFSKNFGTQQPIVYANCFMCPDSNPVDNDTFSLVYKMNLPFNSGYYKVASTSNTLFNLSATAGGANQWLYRISGSRTQVPSYLESRFLLNSTLANAGKWLYEVEKDADSLRTGISICGMNGDFSVGTNMWKAYVYDGTSLDHNYYNGTFIVDSLFFYHNWGSGQPTMTGERCGVTMDNDNYTLAYRMKYNFPSGRYKFRVRSEDGVYLAVRNASNANTSILVNSLSSGTKDITSSFITLSGDTFLYMQIAEFSGNGRASYVHCKEPSDPGTIIASRDTICPGDSVTLRPTTKDGSSTQWFIKSCGGAGILVGTGDSIRIPIDSTTTFYVRNRNFCTSQDTSNTLDLYSQNCSSKRIYLNNSSIQPPTAPTPQSYCSNAPHTFTFSNVTAGSGGSKVEWATNCNFIGSNIATSPATINITTDTSHIDTIWIRSQNSTGCKSSVVTTATQVNKLPTELIPFIVNDTVCIGDTACIKIPDSQLGVKYYLLNLGFTVDSVNGNGDTVSLYPIITIPQMYSVRAINTTTLCYRDFGTILSIDTPPIFNIMPFVTSVSCKGTNSGSVDLSVLGGSVPYTYAWGDGSTNEDRSGLFAGIYTLTVSDKNRCQNIEDTIVVTEPEKLLHAYVSCDTCLDSLITITRYGGVPPYTITWVNGSVVNNGTLVPLGENIIKVIDNAGCEVLDTFFNSTSGATILFFDIQISVLAVSSSAVCNSIEYEMTIENGTSSTLDPSIHVDFPANVTITAIGCNPPYFDLTGITLPLQTDELDLTPTSGGLINTAPNNIVTLTYSVTVPCVLLDEIQPVQGGQNLTFSFDQTISASNAGNYYVVDENPGGITGELSEPSEVHTSLDYPYILMGGINSINTLQMADGEEACLTFNFSNTSTLMNYLNNLELWSYTSGSGCSLTAEVNSIDVISPSYVTIPVLSSPVSLSSSEVNLGELSVSGVGLPQGTPVTVEVCLTAHGCLNNACDVNFYLKWGCDNDLCMTTDPVTFSIEKVEPSVSVSRIVPAPADLGSSHGNAQYAWDNSCMNGSETWQYLIENTGDATAKDVKINLTSILGTFSFIQFSDIKVYDATSSALTDSRFQPSGGTGTFIPATIIVSGNSVSNPQVNYITSAELGTWSGGTPACISNLSLSNIVESYVLTIPELDVDERIVFEFKTIRCCPSEIGFNQGINFNRWRLIVSSYDACEADDGNRIIASNANPLVSYSGGPFTSTFRAFGSLPNNVNDRYAISPHYISSDLGLPDLALTQLFDQSISDISAPKQTGSSQVCGDCQQFRVENLTFPSSDNAVTEFDTQIFTEEGVESLISSGGFTGVMPRGEIKIEFELAQGVTLEPLKLCGANPNITNGLTVWDVKQVLSVPQYNITNGSTNGVAYFDIADLGFNNAHEFLTFFRGSFINFNIKGCCNAHETEPTIIVRTFFKPQTSPVCTDCWIKLSSTSHTVQLHCPGCDVPGVIVDNYTLKRATFGYEDIDNDGRPEAANLGELIDIDDAYPQWSAVRRDRAMAGDLLTGIAHAHFYPGDGLVSNYKSFNVSDWQSEWNPDGKFTKFVFEQVISTSTISNVQADISELNLQYESCTLRYIPDNSNPGIYEDVTLAAIPSLTPAGVSLGAPTGVTNSRALMKFVFDISDFTALGLSEFEPNGNSELILFTQLRVCNNPTKEILINVNNAAYLISHESTLSLGVNDFPYYGGTSYGGQTQALDIIGTAYANAVNYATMNNLPFSFDVFSVVGPTTPTYFICEGFAGSNHVYPVKHIYDEGWDDAVCQKRLDIDINSFVQTDGGNKNVFPYEYRPLPGIIPNPVLFNGLTILDINASFNAEFPLGFAPVLSSTIYRSRINVWQTPSINHIIDILPSNVDMTSSSGIIFSGGTAYNFTEASNVKYAPPFANGIYTGYNASGGNNTSSAVSFGSTPILFVGDESFRQSIKIYSDPPCSNSPQSITLPSGAVYAEAPVFSCTSNGASEVVDNTEFHSITYPNAELSITCDDVSANNVVSQIFNGNQVVARVKVSANPANNLNHIYLRFNVPSGVPYTVTNVYGPFASANAIPPYNVALAGEPLIGNTPTNMAFDMDVYNGQFNNYYYVVLTLEDCNNFTPFNLQTTATWACKEITDINDLSSSCSAVTCSTEFTIPQAVVNPLTVNSSYTYTPCEPLELSACFSSTNYGGAGNFAGTITLPNGVSILPNSVKIIVGSASPVSVTTVTQMGNVVTIDLTSPTAFSSSSLLGLDGFTQAEATLCIDFQVQICTELTDNITADFTYDYYCGTSYSSPFVFGNFVLSNDISACNYPMEVEAYHITDATCSNTDDGAIMITICGGQPPYQYNWSNLGITQEITSLQPGSYIVTVTDANAATLTATYTVNAINVAPILGFSVTDLLCYGTDNGVIDLTLTGGTPNSTLPSFGFLWSGPSITGLNEADEDLTGLGQGSYSVTVSYGDVCEITELVEVVEPAELLATLNVINVLCHGASTGQIDLTVSGGTPGSPTPYTYAWSNAINTEDLTNLSASTYNVTVYDDNGCSTTSTATVTEPVTSLSVTIGSIIPSCSGEDNGSLTATASGGTAAYSYSWQDIDGTNIGNAAIISALAANTYSITVTDANGCTTSATQILTNLPGTLVPTIVSEIVTPMCNTLTTELSVIPGYDSYLWSNNSTTPAISVSTDATYSVTVWGVGNCGVAEYLLETYDCLCEGSTHTSVNNNNQLTFYNLNATTLLQIFGASGNTIDYNLLTTLGINGPVNIAINGVLTIDQNLTIDALDNLGMPIDFNFIMGQGAAIVLANGSTFTSNYVDYYTCGDFLWQGLFILSDQEKFEASHTRIYDASEAVRAENGGAYDISYSSFINNFTGLSIQNKPSGINDNNFVGLNTEFTSNAPIKGAHVLSRFGVLIENSSNAIIGGNSQQGCYFSNMTCGTRVIRSNDITILHCAFNDIVWDPVANLLTSDIGSSYGCAIYADGGAPTGQIMPNRVNSLGNVIIDCTKGIFYTRTRGMIFDQHISGTSLAIQCEQANFGLGVSNFSTNLSIINNTISAADLGICCINNNMAATLIQGNDITLNDGEDVLGFGIRVSNSSLTFAGRLHIRFNNIEHHAYSGIQLEQVGFTSSILGNGTFVEENDIVENSSNTDNWDVNGITLLNCGVMTLQSNTVTGNTSNYNYDNSGNGLRRIGIRTINSAEPEILCNALEYTGYGAFVHGNNARIVSTGLNKFNSNGFNNHRNGLYYMYFGPTNMGTFGNLDDIGNPVDPYGDADNFFIGDYEQISGNDAMAFNNPNGTIQFVSPRVFTDVVNTYITSANSFSSFGLPIDVQQTNGLGIYYAACGVPNFPSYNIMQGGYWLRMARGEIAYDDAVGQKCLDIQTLYTYLDADTALRNADTAFVNFYDAYTDSTVALLLGVKKAIAALSDSTLQLDSAKYFQAIEAAIALNDSIIPVNDLEENEIDMNRLELKVFLHGIDILSGTDSVFIATLAHSCPLIDGSAVYSARSYYAMWYPLEWIDDLYACDVSAKTATEGQNMILEDKSVRDVKIYPNPASNKLFIECNPQDSCTEKNIEVHNIIGVSVLSKRYTPHGSIEELDISHLPVGVYFVSLMDREKEIKVEKLIIMR